MSQTTYPKMNKRIKTKWLKALRGEAKEGPYRQANNGSLHTTINPKTGEDDGIDRFCCLGVLANICNLEGGLDGQDAVYGGYAQPAFEWAGLDWTTAHRLADMNDGGKRFATIANWIEENL